MAAERTWRAFPQAWHTRLFSILLEEWFGKRELTCYPCWHLPSLGRSHDDFP